MLNLWHVGKKHGVMMLDKIPVLIRIPLKFGVVAGMLNVLMMVMFFLFGKHPSLFPIYFDSRIIILLIFIYFVIREYKEYHSGGLLHFWEGMVLGITSYVMVGLLGSLFILLYDLFDPTYLSSYIEGARKGAEVYREQSINGPQAVKMTEDEFNRHITALGDTSAWKLANDYFVKTCFIGFLIPVVYSVFFRKVEL